MTEFLDKRWLCWSRSYSWQQSSACYRQR